MRINDDLRTMREEAWLSKSEFARRAGVSLMTVYRWESQSYRLTADRERQVLARYVEVCRAAV